MAPRYAGCLTSVTTGSGPTESHAAFEAIPLMVSWLRRDKAVTAIAGLPDQGSKENICRAIPEVKSVREPTRRSNLRLFKANNKIRLTTQPYRTVSPASSSGPRSDSGSRRDVTFRVLSMSGAFIMLCIPYLSTLKAFLQYLVAKHCTHTRLASRPHRRGVTQGASCDPRSYSTPS